MGNRKKLEKVCASKTSLTATAMKRPRKVEAMAIMMTAGMNRAHVTPEKSIRKAAMITGTKAFTVPNNMAPLVLASIRTSRGIGASRSRSKERCFFSKVTVTASRDGERHHGGKQTGDAAKAAAGLDEKHARPCQGKDQPPADIGRFQVIGAHVFCQNIEKSHPELHWPPPFSFSLRMASASMPVIRTKTSSRDGLTFLASDTSTPAPSKKCTIAPAWTGLPASA